MRVVNWIRHSLERLQDRRRTPRLRSSDLVAYYWDGSVPRAHSLRDISRAGAYVYTDERWYLGTLVKFTMQLQTEKDQDANSTTAPSIHVRTKVVRHGEDGVGIQFVPLNHAEQTAVDKFLATISPHAGAESSPPPMHARSEAGQALIEFALILPLVFLLVVNCVNFGGFLYAWIAVANAARTGAEYASMGGAVLGMPGTPSNTNIIDLVTADMLSMLNRSSLKVCVSKNHNGTTPATFPSGTCSSPNAGTLPADPEAANYDLVTVDVAYTYQPFIPLWSFPRLGIQATLPATTIHRRAVMRMLQ